MDVVRSNRSQSLTSGVSLILLLAACVTSLALLASRWGLRTAARSAPVIARDSLWTDTVQRGELVHSIRGVGTLTPQTILWLPAITAGRVAKIHVMPGDRVLSETCLVSLTNPTLQYAVTMAEAEMRAAQQKLEAMSARLQGEALDMEARLVETQARHDTSLIELEVSEKAATAIPKVKLKLLRVTAESLGRVVEVQTRRLATFRETIENQLASQQSEIDLAKTKLDLERERQQGLQIAAGMDGILEQMPIEVGQRIEAGDVLAKVIDPQNLKATLRVAESHGSFVAVGQNVEIDTHHGKVDATVARIDPAVQQGNVLVDVVFQSKLPPEARPDLSVIGTIEIERLRDTLYVGRPVLLSEHGDTNLFRLVSAGTIATKTAVQFGRSSPSHVQVLEGLQAGDEIILSDMSRWDAFDELTLKE